MRIDKRYLTETLSDLIRINSINPAFTGGATNEAEIASHVAEALARLGMQVTPYEPEPNRISVVGRVRGSGDGRTLILYAHLDTVGVEGMPEPFSGAVRDGRVYGRGAYDMKGGLAACMTAVKALADEGAQLAGDVLLVAVADEEVASIGMSDVLDQVTADAAIVTESTDMRVCIAHKGFCWIEVETLGRAAHGSRFNEGIDANMRMGRFLAQLEVLERELRGLPGHRLLGPPSLHAAVLRGGTGTSTYAASCRLEIERRTIPGESENIVVSEIQGIVERLSAADETFKARVAPFLTRPPFEISPDAPIVQALTRAATDVVGHPPPVIGEPYWMDAALLSEKGIDTAVLGPMGAGAHAAEEWVDIESLAQLADILARTATRFCGPC